MGARAPIALLCADRAGRRGLEAAERKVRWSVWRARRRRGVRRGRLWSWRSCGVGEAAGGARVGSSLTGTVRFGGRGARVMPRSG